MAERDADLQHFINAARAAIRANDAQVPDALPMVDRLFAALDDPGELNPRAEPCRLPVCGHLEPAYAPARHGPEPVSGLANAFAAIEPRLAWFQRQGAEGVPDGFQDNHANAYIVGRDGLEQRKDVLIGVSLVAPETPYPRHRHPPEELYVVLSSGSWMQNDGPMTSRQTGDLVHNPPNVWHAMEAGRDPLLAVWCLWLDG